MRMLYHRFRNAIHWRKEVIMQFFDFKFHKIVYVFGAPYHSNAGDQAQTFCIEQWVKANYSEYQVRIFDTQQLTKDDFRILKIIRKAIKDRDYIFLHSGYHTTDLYMLEENMQRRVVTMFPEKKIVMLPQTIHYETEIELQRAQEVYNNHDNLIMMCRDDTSYQTAKEIFPKCKLLLYPDIVTSLIGKYMFYEQRKGILLCMRNDKEAFYTKEQIESLKSRLKEIDTVSQTDTTIPEAAKDIEKNRKEILENIWKKYSQYRVIITDRYHGTIFSLIANTPVLVLSSTDHKLSSGVKWFPKEFADYVQYVPNIENIPLKVKNVYSKGYLYNLPSYFEDKYYSKLKNILEEI